MAATQIDSLCPQSKVAQDNMDVFKDQWEKQVRVLTEAVDDITSVDDFLSVSEGDVDTLDRTAGAIRGRAARVIHIINAEMENYEAGVYTEKVLEATKLLSETVVHHKNILKENLLSFLMALNRLLNREGAGPGS
ncbi:hypothetical protein E2320_007314 [Naja naja]|nr:hypothetical protein E2320_007314 [Naja naja]